MKKLLKLTCVLASTLLIMSCATSNYQSKISSNKDPEYDDVPRRIFVVTDIGTDFGVDYGDSFQESFSAKMNDCDIKTEISRVVINDRARESRLAAIKKFEPNVMLSIMRSGGVNYHLAIISVTYDIKLIDVKTNKTIWRAEASIEKGDFTKIKQRGEILARDLINKMKADRVLKSCTSSN